MQILFASSLEQLILGNMELKHWSYLEPEAFKNNIFFITINFF